MHEKQWKAFYEDHNADLYPFYYWIDFYLQNPTLKNAPKEKLAVFRNGTVTYYVDEEEYAAAAREVFRKIMEQDYWELLEQKTEEYVRKLLEFGERVKREDVRQLTNEDLVKRMQELEDVMAGSIIWGSTLTVLDFSESDLLLGGIEQEIEEKLREKGRDGRSASEVLSVLSMPTKGTYLRKEKRERLKIARQIAESEGLKKWFRKNAEEIQDELPSIDEKLDALIARHASTYAWIHYGYQGPELPKSHFIAELKDDVEQGGIGKKLEEAEREEEERERSVRELLEELELKEDTKKRLDISRRFGYSKNLRKEAGYFDIHAIENVQREMARRSRVTPFQLRYFLPEEVEEALLKGKKLEPAVAEERRERCVYLYENGKRGVVSGTEAEEWEKKLEKQGKIEGRKGLEKRISVKQEAGKEAVVEIVEIKGQCACAGFARGRVKVVRKAEEVGKMEEGDVLVSWSTNPNMVPGMKKAAAIVTDVGGVTCHAAIVSRELGIPCVIGTKKASKVLKDGDFVEVDAAKGIIRKL